MNRKQDVRYHKNFSPPFFVVCKRLRFFFQLECRPGFSYSFLPALRHCCLMRVCSWTFKKVAVQARKRFGVRSGPLGLSCISLFVFNSGQAGHTACLCPALVVGSQDRYGGKAPTDGRTICAVDYVNYELLIQRVDPESNRTSPAWAPVANAANLCLRCTMVPVSDASKRKEGKRGRKGFKKKPGTTWVGQVRERPATTVDGGRSMRCSHGT